jgi:hypothetical protein
LQTLCLQKVLLFKTRRRRMTGNINSREVPLFFFWKKSIAEKYLAKEISGRSDLQKELFSFLAFLPFSVKATVRSFSSFSFSLHVFLLFPSSSLTWLTGSRDEDDALLVVKRVNQLVLSEKHNSFAQR